MCECYLELNLKWGQISYTPPHYLVRTQSQEQLNSTYVRACYFSSQPIWESFL